MKFTLPEQLPGTIAELEALLHTAESEFDELSALINDEGTTVTEDMLKDMKALDAAAEKLQSEIDKLQAEDNARLEEARQLTERRQARAAKDAPPDEDDDEDESTEETGEDDTDDENEDEPEPVQSEADADKDDAEEKDPALAASRKTSFQGLGKSTGKSSKKVAPKPQIGFRMSPGANKYVEGLVGYKELAAAIDNMAVGANVRQNRGIVEAAPHRVPMSLATLDRGFTEGQIVDDQHDLVEVINEAANFSNNYKNPVFGKDGAMAASGGWCAPSEKIYTFCDVPAVADVISLPEFNSGSNRPGLQWPLEPDFTDLYATLPFRYTEAELQAVDVNGDPTVTKPCVEIPCPGFDEIRPEAIGLCVTAGILQKRGWPELIQKFMAETMLAHQHKLSAWTILDMIADSTPVTFTDAFGFAAAGASLNALDLAATNIRILERLPRTAPIEGVAPVWYPAVLRADLAYNTGRDPKAVTDAEVDGWLAARNIRFQYVVDWQTRGAGQPGVATTVAWPTSVQVLLYPAGAWFRHLANVIEVGSLYDKAQLQANRYTELFTEDEYYVTRRCRTSQVVTIPLCANGAIGERVALTCGTNT
ncbi:major capsid protein [Rhodococcus koreensis]